ncbi:hypothetical protein LCGC14_1662980 [marine sediment metagenome]|uniref:Uncharacterized protein n=1 Tax=marine sediment metagenome TaxID=412755 RepID=A0A0F9HU89_9ZZZZ
MPTPALYYQISILDPHGRLAYPYPEMPAHSFVKGYLMALHTFFMSATVGSFPNTSGVNRVLRDPSLSGTDPFEINGGVNDDLHGTVCGTGDTPVTLLDYALETQILTGVGAGQMEYGLVSMTPYVPDGSNGTISIFRVIANNSPGLITVKETGIYYKWDHTGSIPDYFMMVRDVLPAAVPVAVGESMAITYTLKISL